MQLIGNYSAIYLPMAGLKPSLAAYHTFLGSGWLGTLNPDPGQLAGYPGAFTGEQYLGNGVNVVEAVASGRKAACTIDKFLNYLSRKI